MVAGWHTYGFMHGVINTDKVSILGLTIDYGPYAFMDVYDFLHICNHTDEGVGSRAACHILLEECTAKYAELMRKRLGLQKTVASNKFMLVRPLLSMLENYIFDFHLTFRALCDFSPEPTPST
ncbi:UPF0061-domain-containing protein [Schizophyllum commune Loenen D]|nr:UPF0061-domain-containing protein [Schizophyllum commune Loenen D]